MDTPNDKPLAGLKVIDFTRVFAGPYCSMLLADLGADVVKVELPGEGDPLRTQGPPFHHGIGITFLATNRNKRSITLDMGTDEGKKVARRLCLGADVVVENFRPDVMPRLGLGYDALAAENPKLVYASISGLGANGPDKDVGAFDLTIQAIGGYMSITGERGGQPSDEPGGKGIAQVETDIAFARVQLREIHGLAVDFRRDDAGGVARGAFDLDDVGAQVGQDTPDNGACHDLGKIEHADAGERPGLSHRRILIVASL
jgi:hypothetical protein